MERGREPFSGDIGSRPLSSLPFLAPVAIDVTGLADQDATESTETVTITIQDGNTCVGEQNHKAATVQVLNKKKYLLAYNGAGTGGFGNDWLDQIAFKASSNNGYNLVKRGENDERGLLLGEMERGKWNGDAASFFKN